MAANNSSSAAAEAPNSSNDDPSIAVTAAIDFSTAVLRPATTSDEDINAIVALGRKVFFETFAHTVAPEAMDQYLEDSYSYKAIKADLTNPARQCILAEARNEHGQNVLLGYSFLATGTTEDCLKDYPNVIELLRIYTHPATHGKGIAKQLAEASYELGINEGYDHIFLGVYPQNYRAIKFYEKQGFKKVGTHVFMVGDHEDIDDVMVRSLKA
ncbi:hypothetical protein OC834_000623 [Tilletia horrida]|nr:hypothetical protein OC834_000623 [Tilletia horrida]KAK0560739.1 hypothetical protein OC844_003590 [Tilletia horrida]